MLTIFIVGTRQSLGVYNKPGIYPYLHSAREAGELDRSGSFSAKSKRSNEPSSIELQATRDIAVFPTNHMRRDLATPAVLIPQHVKRAPLPSV